MLLLTTYVALNEPSRRWKRRSRSWRTNPKDFSALYYIMFFTRPLCSAESNRRKCWIKAKRRPRPSWTVSTRHRPT